MRRIRLTDPPTITRGRIRVRDTIPAVVAVLLALGAGTTDSVFDCRFGPSSPACNAETRWSP